MPPRPYSPFVMHRGREMMMHHQPHPYRREPFPIQGISSPRRKDGGLLKKLFNRSTSPGAMKIPGQASRSSNSIIQSLSNPDTITKFLSNTQQVINTAQSIGPMIQQYGPLVRNFPTMWKLFRSLKNADSDTENNNTTIELNELEKETELIEVESSSSLKIDNGSKKDRKKGNSHPKLYI